MKSLTPEKLIELAMEADLVDPVDWGLITIEERKVYEVMASNVIEQFSNIKDEDQLLIALATLTKLLVENFVLNYQLGNRK
jgi:hypothetical protein